MTTAIFRELESEMKRARVIIEQCEATPTISFAALWLRALVRQGEQAIDDHDVRACMACLKELRAIE